MTIREQIIVEAKTWIGTPYCDHAGVKRAGVDCAFYPTRVYQAVGLIPKEYIPPKYSPHQWLRKGIEDRTYLGEILKYAKHEVLTRELTDADPRPELPVIRRDPLPGDLVLYHLVESWTHGGIIVSWPSMILHSVRLHGVVGFSADAGNVRRRARRFFDFVGD